MAKVLQILVSESPRDPMVVRDRVRAVPGRGLEGDRYFNGIGTFSPQPARADFELTLIESEQLLQFVRTTALDFTAMQARRNLVTAGCDLNAAVGRELQVGAVRIRGIRLCEPCSHLARITHPEVLRGLVHRGGLRAQILTEGWIEVGDKIEFA